MQATPRPRGGLPRWVIAGRFQNPKTHGGATVRKFGGWDISELRQPGPVVPGPRTCQSKEFT
jgi:hypothetical protein